jgi:site-specific DNA-methyltransferase (adenine-specific)
VLIFSRGRPAAYNPQKTPGKPYKDKGRAREIGNYGHMRSYVRRGGGERFPTDLLKFDCVGSNEIVHPTQRPVALCESLIRTYTEPGQVVLDDCAGSGTTAVAAIRAGRNWVAFEKDRKFFEIAQERIGAELADRPLEPFREWPELEALAAGRAEP